MKRLLGIAFAGMLTLGIGAPAYADHDWGGGGYRDNDGRECRGGGCGNEREEDYSQGGCKYICPQDSPITDSFNVCLPGSTCHFDGRQDGDQGDEGQQPS